MNARTAQLHLGLGACALSLLMIFWIIPSYVSSPSNVRNIILSPLFWPYTLAGIMGIVGLGLLATRGLVTDSDEPINPPVDDAPQAWIRLGVIAVIMLATMAVMSWLGMVWTSMLCFAATAFLVRTRHPKLAVLCAVVIPLALYAFFAHVAGVAIPQGELIRLP